MTYSDEACGAAKTVCILIPTLANGGAERQTLWLAGALARQGYRVILLTQSDAAEDFFALPAGVVRDSIGVIGGPGRRSLSGKILRHGLRLLPVRAALRRHRADVVLGMMPHQAVTAILAAAGLGLRVVVSERNAAWNQMLHPILALLRRRLYRWADLVVVQTEPIAEWIRSVTASPHVAIVPNAVQEHLPVAGLAVSPPTWTGPRRKLLLAAGTKPHQKGFDLLVAAFARVADRHPEWDLAIVGMAADRLDRGLSATDIADQVRQIGLGPRVLLPGVVGNMADWYAAADLFVLSSRFEGIPNVLIEAMSMGCPTVAFDCPTGPREMLRDGVDGLLVPRICDASLAAALDRAMGDAILRARLGRQARQILRRHGPAPVLAAWLHALALPASSEPA